MKKVSEMSFKSNDLHRNISELEKRKKYNQSSKQLIEFDELKELDSKRELNVQMQQKQDHKESNEEVEELSLEEGRQSMEDSREVKSGRDFPEAEDLATMKRQPGEHEGFLKQRKDDLMRILTAQAKLNEEFLKSK